MFLYLVGLNFFLAYEGQSGSKDRGDPEVSIIQRLDILRFERGVSPDVQSFCCQFAFQRYGAILGPVLCAPWTRWLCRSSLFAEPSLNLQHVLRLRLCGLVAMAAVVLVVI